MTEGLYFTACTASAEATGGPVNDPPWVLNCPTLTTTRPQPQPLPVTLSPQAPVTVPWPRYQATAPPLPAPPGIIRQAAPPQAPRRTLLPPALACLLSDPAVTG